jgi:hypothetical protein
MKKTGRNNPCPCGSGKKYKNCCMDKDQQKERITREHGLEPDYEIPTLDRSHLDDISTDAEVFDEFWAKFEGTDFDEKVSLIERAYDDPSLMEDADFVYEILNDLNKAATTISEREIFAGMVKRFVMKKHMPNDRQSFVDVRSLSGLSFSPQT